MLSQQLDLSFVAQERAPDATRSRTQPRPGEHLREHFRQKEGKKKPPGLRNLSGFNELSGRR